MRFQGRELADRLEVPRTVPFNSTSEGRAAQLLTAGTRLFERMASSHRACVSFLVVFSLVGLSLIVLTPTFETNDDPWMMLTLSGRMTTDAPTGHVIFMNLILGDSLAILYRMAPQIAWYAWFHILLISAALWATLYELLRCDPVRRLLLFVFCFAVFSFPLLTNLQFTRTSFFAGMCGILLAVRILHRSQLGGRLSVKSAAGLAASGVLITLASLMRQESLVLAAVLSAPLIGVSLWRAWRLRRWRLFVCLVVPITACVAILQVWSETSYKRNAEWADYHEFNGLASRFIDYGGIRDQEQLDRALDEVGWSENDYRMLRTWFYVDPVTYSMDNLRRAATFVVRKRSVAEIGEATALVARRLRGDAVALAAALGLMGFVVWRSPRDLLLLESVTLALALALLVFLAAFMKMPPRVYESVLIYPVWLALVHPAGGDVRERPERFARLRISLAVAFLVASVGVSASAEGSIRRAFRIGSHRVEVNQHMKEALRAMQPRLSQTFFVWGSAFPFEAVFPFESTAYLRNVRAVGAGSSSQSPIQNRMLALQGIEDLHQALFLRDDVFLIIPRDQNRRDSLATFTEEHYGVEVTFEHLYELHLADVVKMVEIPER